MNQNNMEVLLSYKFENKYLVELKRLDAPEGTPKHKKLSFVWIDYDEDLISKLNFVSIKESNEVVTREFKEGSLVVSKGCATINIHGNEYTTKTI